MTPGRTDDLCLGGTKGFKRVHHEGCRYAKKPYQWARRQPSLRALAEDLAASGAWNWHRPCRYCCRDLADEMIDALMRGQG